MQIKFLAGLLLLAVLYTSCDEKNNTVSETKKDSAQIQPQNFFPVTAFILGELAMIDSMPVTPLKITTVNGKEDSIWMKREDVRKFAQPFLQPRIDTGNMKNLFSEKSFLDQTINAFTFSYDPVNALPDSMQLKRWDVYIDPQTHTIRRIYIVKQIKSAEGYQTLQLTWQAGHWCKIIVITKSGDTEAVTKDEKLIWDFNEQPSFSS